MNRKIKLVIIGAGNGYWELFDLIGDLIKHGKPYEIIAILDDNESLHGKYFNGIIVEGPIKKRLPFYKNCKFVFAIGSHKNRLLRTKLIDSLKIPKTKYETLIHPLAKIYSHTKIGFGCIIHFGTIVFCPCEIETMSVISANCVIGPQNYISKSVLIGSNVTTTTGVRIGPSAFIGSSSTISENVEIGAGSIVGIGSVIYKNVSNGVVLLGNPPKVYNVEAMPKSITNYWEKVKKTKGI